MKLAFLRGLAANVLLLGIALVAVGLDRWAFLL